MSEPVLPALADWGNFYVIIGSAAAGLTGLMFVVITLGAQSGRIRSEQSLRAYVTPTIVHFCAVLLTAAVVATPRHTTATLGIAVGACAVAGLAYVGRVMLIARRFTDYTPVTEDWIWHGLMPTVAYGTLLVAASLVLWRASDAALYLLGGATVLLLFTGIHNAWDSAVWVAIAAQGSAGAGSGGSQAGT